MLICADQNLPPSAVELLRRANHDVLSILEVAPGIPDTEVLALAVRESRTIVTFDKGDFGALIFERRLPPPPGLILFRISDLEVEGRPYFMLGAVAARTDWQGSFWAVNRRRARSRPFPD